MARDRRDPDTVRLAGGTRRTLVELAASGLVLGVISGRALPDVRARVQIENIWYAGDHGFVVQGPGRRLLNLLTPVQRRHINHVAHQLRQALSGLAGVTVEAKGATVAVHYRRAGARDQHLAADVVQRTIGRHQHLRLMHGKKVWEILPSGDIDKTAAVRHILLAERHDLAETWLSVYMGDDVADERVFIAWPGLSVAVGYQPHTAAQYYLRSLAEVREFLRRLADAL